MQRTEIRNLKRTARNQGNAQAMLALLERSVRFGHRRLALLRCIDAEKMGIAVTPHLLDYCRDIADRMPRDELEKFIFRAGTRPTTS
jgi:hypothetical protein